MNFVCFRVTSRFLEKTEELWGNAVKGSSEVVRGSPMHCAYRFFEVNKFQTPGGNCVTLKVVTLQVKEGKRN